MSASDSAHAHADAADGRADGLMAGARRAMSQNRLVRARALLDAARMADGEATDDADELDARLLLAEGFVPGALARADAGLARNPENWRLRCARADIRLQAGDARGAASDSADAVIAGVEGNAQGEWAHNGAAAKASLGSALLALGLAKEARACLAEAVSGNQAHVGYRLALARAQAALGETDSAEATLADGIASRPAASALHLAAIRLAVGQRDFPRAVALAGAAMAEGVADACILGLRGHALSNLERDDEATQSYRDSLYLAPEDAYVRHLVAAAGLIAPPSRPSAEYIRVLFDGFADHFEGDLIRLDYRIPGLVRAALLAHAPWLAPETAARAEVGAEAGAEGRAVLDIGCGTGLVAVVLSDLCLGPFTGIDLSPAMLAKARAKGLYAELVEGEVCAELRRLGERPGRFGLAIAADLLPYMADPAPLLAALAPNLAEGGLFVLTAETLDPDDEARFRLGRRARYAHRADALADAASRAGWAVRECRADMLRRDHGEKVQGCIMTLQRHAGSAGR